MLEKLKLLALMGSLLVVWSSCGDDDPDTDSKGSLEIVFKATYGSEPFVKGKVYDYFGVGTVLFTKSEFYLSDITLSGDHHDHTLASVDYISISDHHTTLENAQAGLTLTFDSIPSGNYQALKFNLGLTAAQNKTVPANYAPTHPMGEGNRYWSAWNSYIFSKTEGSFNNGSQSFNFTYHSGFDDSMKAVEMIRSILVEAGKKTRLVIEIDHKALFAEDANGMDIAANPQIHNKSSLMDAFMNRYQTAFHMQ